MENEDGGSKRSRYLDKVATELKVSFKWLMNGVGSPFEREDSGLIRWLPIMDPEPPYGLGQRKPIPVWMLTDLSDSALLFQVQDDAMAPAMPKGTWVVCDDQAQPVPGGVVLLRESAEDNGSPTLRVWRDRDISVELVPDNPDYAPLHVGKIDADLMVVVASFRAMDLT